MSTLQLAFESLKLIYPWMVTIGALLLLLWTYFSTRKNSGFRGVITYLLHLIIVGVGWWMGEWIGLLLIAVPIMVLYYYVLFHLAMVTIPVSNPDSWEERRKCFLLFVWYQWGVQYPVWIVTNSVGWNMEARIPGNPSGLFAPGLVVAHTHQAIELSSSSGFSKASQSGTVFTKAYERPISIIDLRSQLRTLWIDVISNDGIPYRVLLSIVFDVDKERWNLDFVETTALEWEETVLHQVAGIALETLSRRELIELWQVDNESYERWSMEEIANEIEARCSLQLRQFGIQLHSCRVVDFDFSTKEAQQAMDELTQARIMHWRTEAELVRQDARAYAYASLLMAVAEGLKETRLQNPNLLQHVMLVRFTSALERLIAEQPGIAGSNEARISLADVKKLKDLLDSSFGAVA